MQKEAPDNDQDSAAAKLQELLRDVAKEHRDRTRATGPLLKNATPEERRAFDAHQAAAKGNGVVDEIRAHEQGNEMLRAAATRGRTYSRSAACCMS